MSSPLLEAAVEAVEIEAFSKDIPSLIPKSTTAYSLFKNRATTIPVSNVTSAGGVTRPSFRVPFRPQAGAAIAQGTGDASSLGRGTGSAWDGFALSPVFLFNVCEISYLAQTSTSGKARGLFNVKAQELKNSFDQAMQGIEGLINSDGSGALDQIPTTAVINNGTGTGNQLSSIVGMNVAFAFTDQQVVQVISTGGVNRGTATISTVDPVSNTLYFSTVLPVGTVTTDFLVVQGASGAAGSSIFGIKYWQVNSNTGTLAGIARSKWPGRLSTPTINLAGGPITQGVAQRAQVLLGRALGPDNKAMKSAVWYGPPEQAYSISNIWYNVQISQNLEKDTGKVPDMARRYFSETFGGRDYHTSWVAEPDRVDLLLFDTWYMGEMIPLELYDFGSGMTVVPVPDVGTVNGTYLTSHMFAYNCAFQLANSAPKAGLYLQQCEVPEV